MDCSAVDREKLQSIKNILPGMDLDLVSSFVSIIKSSRRLINNLTTFLSNNKLSQARFLVLMELLRSGEHPLSPSILARQYDVKSSSMTGVLDTLERDGLIERLRSSEDRRKILTKLTRQGREFILDFLPRYQKLMAGTLSSLSDRESEQFITMFKRLNSSLFACLQDEMGNENGKERDGRIG